MKDTMMIMMMKSTFYQLRIFNFIIYHFHFNFYLLSNRENEWTKAVKKGYKTASHLLYLPTLWLWCEHVSLALLVFDKWYGTGVFSPAKRTKWFKIFPIFTHFSFVLCLFVIRQKAFLINWMAGWLVSCSVVCQVDTKLECLTKWSDHGVGCRMLLTEYLQKGRKKDSDDWQYNCKQYISECSRPHSLAELQWERHITNWVTAFLPMSFSNPHSHPSLWIITVFFVSSLIRITTTSW